jgi:uncharacterized protein YggE
MHPATARAVSVAAVLLLVSGQSHPASAQEPEPKSTTSEIRTQATARRAVRSNLATLTVQVAALGLDPREAGARLAARVDSVRRALRTLGIPRDSIWTSTSSGWYWQGRVEVVPGQQVWHNPPPGVRGQSFVTQDTTYRLRDIIEIRVSDMKKVGPVIDTLLALRITEISGPRFVATNTAEAREQALREATKLARQQAETMAQASDMRLGKLLMLNSSPGHGEAFGFLEARAASAGMVVPASHGPPTSVVEPFVQVEVTVAARWEVLQD